jgi:hypothetical protein
MSKFKIRRSLGVRIINSIGGGLRSLGIPLLKLNEGSLVKTAMKNTGLSDFGGDNFMEGFRLLLHDLENKSRLNFIGRGIARAEMVRNLENRLKVTEDWKRHPEIAQEKIVRPLFIIGMPRTGSTILHDLLAHDPENRVPLTWEVLWPSPPTERATFDSDPRIEACDESLAKTDRLIPGFKAMHFMGARLAQECVALMTYDFMSVIFSNSYRVPTYHAWMDQADLRPLYETHRRQLQYMQWHCPGERWVLKSGAHLWGMDHLFETYPNACVVQTHRDPLRVMASFTSLVSLVRSMASDDVDSYELGIEWSQSIAGALRKAMEFRDSGKIDTAQFFDMHYKQFNASPIAMVRKIYNHFGLELSDTAEESMRNFLANNPKGKHGLHRYTLSEFGLDPATDRKRYRFYQERYGIETEPMTDK